MSIDDLPEEILEHILYYCIDDFEPIYAWNKSFKLLIDKIRINNGIIINITKYMMVSNYNEYFNYDKYIEWMVIHYIRSIFNIKALYYNKVHEYGSCYSIVSGEYSNISKTNTNNRIINNLDFNYEFYNKNGEIDINTKTRKRKSDKNLAIFLPSVLIIDYFASNLYLGNSNLFRINSIKKTIEWYINIVYSNIPYSESIITEYTDFINEQLIQFKIPLKINCSNCI